MLNSEKLAWLRLSRSKNIGSKSFFKLIKEYKTAQNALNSLQNTSFDLASLEQIEQEISATHKFGAQFLFACEDEYPALLKQTDLAPAVLIYKGDKSLLNKKTIGVVGTRNPSTNGMNFTSQICKEIGAEKIIVCSGLAKGIDTIAHKSCLNSGTIAVIAGGIDHVYPKENSSLYTDIIEKGLLLSELATGSAPLASHFPQRNRIIAGLSQVLVVTEATKHSGSLITAAYSRKYGREIFATPGHPNDRRYNGTNHLIKTGATLLETATDILKSSTLDNIISSDLKTNSNWRLNKPEQHSILNSLSFTPTPIDDVIANSGLSIEQANILLVELELAGKVERTFGNFIALIK